jgi:hypothetical protein
MAERRAFGANWRHGAADSREVVADACKAAADLREADLDACEREFELRAIELGSCGRRAQMSPRSPLRDCGQRTCGHPLRTARQGIDVESDEASKRRQAKGILMERHRISPEDAFDILRNSSRQLNVRLREVARTLTETDQV